jgi:hypothetical protein
LGFFKGELSPQPYFTTLKIMLFWAFLLNGSDYFQKNQSFNLFRLDFHVKLSKFKGHGGEKWGIIPLLPHRIRVYTYVIVQGFI